METILILLAGFLFGCGFYMLLRRNLTRLLVGLLFLSQAANLAVLALAGLGAGGAAIVVPQHGVPPAGYPDPLPQALILTAIVIGFGLSGFAVVLLRNAYVGLRTSDLDRLKQTDR